MPPCPLESCTSSEVEFSPATQSCAEISVDGSCEICVSIAGRDSALWKIRTFDLLNHDWNVDAGGELDDCCAEVFSALAGTLNVLTDGFSDMLSRRGNDFSGSVGDGVERAVTVEGFLLLLKWVSYIT